MEKLKVGDVVHSHNMYWGYSRASVVARLTNTRAILEDGTVIVNTPKYGNRFDEYGNDNTSYYLETEAIKEEVALFNAQSEAGRLISELRPKSLSKPQLDQLIELLTSFNQ